MNELRLRAVNAPWWSGIEFLIYEVKEGRRYAIGTNIEMQAVTPEIDAVQIEPTFRLSYESAQILMDELWRCGLRPSDGTGNTGQLAATQAHLEDMRKIAFKFISDKT